MKRRAKGVEAASSKRPQSPPESNGSASRLWFWLVAASLLVVYLALYGGTTIGRGDGMSRGLLLLLLPFDPESIVNQWVGGSWTRAGIFDRAPIVFVALVWTAAAYVAGAILLTAIRIRTVQWAEWTAFALGAGFQVLSVIMLCYGLLAAQGIASLQSRWPLVALIGGLFAVAAWRRSWVTPPQSGSTQQTDGTNAATNGAADGFRGLGWPAILLPVFALLLIAACLVPPWEFDVREYHLQTPKEWYRSDGVRFSPHNVYSNMPLGAEMHALAGMTLFGGEDGWWRGALVGKCVLGMMNCVAALAIFGALSRSVGQWAGALGAVLYLSWPWAVYVAAAGLIDGALAMYVLLAFLAVNRAMDLRQERESVPWLLAAAACAAGAASTKYTGLLFAAAPLGLWIVGEYALRRQGAEGAKAIIAFSLIAIGLASPWYAKNAMLTGNPIYPLAGDVLGGATRTPEKNQQWSRGHRIPVDQAGRSFTLAQVGDGMRRVLWSSPWHHPVVVPLACLGLFGLRHRTQVARIWIAILTLFVLWFVVTHRIDRFWLSLGPLYCLAAGYGVGQLEDKAWRNAVQAIVGATSIVVLIFLSTRMLIDNRILVSYSELRRDIVSELDPTVFTLSEAHDFLNQQTSQGAAVLLVGDAQPFDLTPKVFYNTCFDDCLFEQWCRDVAPAEQHEALRSRNIEFVLVDWAEIDRYRGSYGYSDYPQPEVFNELTSSGVLQRVEFETSRTRPGLRGRVEIYQVTTDIASMP